MADGPRLLIELEGEIIPKVQRLIEKSGSKDSGELFKKALVLYGAVLMAVENGDDVLSLQPLGQNLRITIEKTGLKLVK